MGTADFQAMRHRFNACSVTLLAEFDAMLHFVGVLGHFVLSLANALSESTPRF
jgi:hypothetical protein